MNVKELLAYCESTETDLLACLEAAVKIESPTSSKPHVDRMARFCAERVHEQGGKVWMLREHGTPLYCVYLLLSFSIT